MRWALVLARLLAGSCQDDSEHCPAWAQRGQCEANQRSAQAALERSGTSHLPSFMYRSDLNSKSVMRVVVPRLASNIRVQVVPEYLQAAFGAYFRGSAPQYIAEDHLSP